MQHSPVARTREPVQIIELPGGECHWLVCAQPAGCTPFTSSTRRGHIADLTAALRASVPDTCRMAVDYLDLPAPERDGCLTQVADLGIELFHALFPDAGQRAIFRGILGARQGQPIRAVMGAACIPWEAVCVVERGQAPTYADFLGWRHTFVRETYGISNAHQRPGGPRSSGGRTRVGLIEDGELDSVIAGRNARTLQPWIGSQLDADPWLGLTVGSDAEGRFRTFVGEPSVLRAMLHFDCHVENRGRLVETSHVRVSDGVPIRFSSFDPAVLTIQGSPFVMFNGCNGGTVNAHGIESYAKRLREAGACTVLSTEAEIGDDFAAEFAQTFYAVAGHGDPVETALLKVRRLFLAHDRNPFALFYGLYGDSQYRLPISVPEPAKLQPSVRGRIGRLGEFWPEQGFD